LGVWVEAQIDLSKKYAREVLKLIEEGLLGWSSGSVPHLVEKLQSWLKRWPVVEFSLTPTPAEPRTLGVEQLKKLFNAAGLELPQALAEAPEGAPARQEPERETETDDRGDTDMDDKQFKALVASLVAEGLTEEEATKRATAEKARLEKEATDKVAAEAEEKRISELVKKNIALVMAEPPAARGALLTGAPNLKKVTDRGFADDEMKSFRHYIRTGDDTAYKAAMQGQTDDEGGNAVPDGFYERIVEKRDEVSVVRRAGATVIPTTRDRILVPKEGTSATAFVRTAEEGSVDENEPTLGQTIITVHRNTKLIKVSLELVSDAVDLDRFLSGVFARAEAAWENDMFLTGTGTNQPQGAVVGSDLGVTAAGTNALTAAEVIDLEFSLTSPYADGAVFAAKRSVEGAIRALGTGVTTNWAFDTIPQGTTSGRSLRGNPIYNSEEMAALATAQKVLLFGNFEFYFIAERSGMFVQRLNELYAGTGQIGLLASYRRGGAVIHGEAFKHILTS
jgi:HK97 family phage major capsid protein